MQRYIASRFDGSTFIVIDQKEQREVCTCENYEDWGDAEERAKKIAVMLNTNEKKYRLD
jgi:hypothetical protein